ncbi:hypothetical protein JHN59_11545 [Streptomyces sp. MBT49]|uniref:hypothetical protein n=1 Tax=unclassified Streptomyces TaxID=2593676 RepID=UPI00190C544E|nr:MULTISPECIES: hypothetical protein [unclassified Streptomyces]MBK3625469.1 hypothetical protein [Streptomyces sp. MBT49]MBK3633268.1 hypothetical protein [Streptomyces sp. MBT97]
MLQPRHRTDHVMLLGVLVVLLLVFAAGCAQLRGADGACGDLGLSAAAAAPAGTRKPAARAPAQRTSKAPAGPRADGSGSRPAGTATTSTRHDNHGRGHGDLDLCD